MRNKKENILQRMGTNALLGVLEIIAEKNAASLCKGFMYEPEIPEKLRNEKSCNKQNIEHMGFGYLSTQ